MSAVSPFSITPAVTVQQGGLWRGVWTLHNPTPMRFTFDLLFTNVPIDGIHLGVSDVAPYNYRQGNFVIEPYSDFTIRGDYADVAGVAVDASVPVGKYTITFMVQGVTTEPPTSVNSWDTQWTLTVIAPIVPPEGEGGAPFVPPYNIPLDVWNQLTDEQKAGILAASQGIAPPITVPTTVKDPWYMNLGASLGDFGAWVQGGANSIVTSLQGGANSVVKAINDAASSIWSGLINNIPSIFGGFSKEMVDKQVAAILDGTSHSTPEKTQIDAMIKKYVPEQYHSVVDAAGKPVEGMRTFTPSEAANSLAALGLAQVAAQVGAYASSVAVEALGLGQLETFAFVLQGVNQALGFLDASKAMIDIPLEEHIFKPARQFYASQFTPEIPPYNDLVNMRVKEKITQVEFESNVAFHGYSKYWAGKIWDAHFNAPNLNDVLTAWRRGKISEARVDELMILIDLDPFYKGVFDTRKYIDPPVNMARFMFETGAIGADRVADLVHRAGYSESDAKAVVDYILRFQERRYRTRLLTALATGRAYGAFSDDDIRTEVRALGQTDAVADLIIRLADVRAKTEMARITHPKPRLLSLGELKRGFMHNVVDEDAIRTELMTRGYELGQVDLLVSVMNADKVVDVAGGKKAALTVSELKQAFQYNEIGEDALRQTLLLRGLDLSEVDMLINTWKKSWGVVSA
jgi:hypothetical protein